MSGNTLGTLFTVTTFGESHGSAIGCVIDGCPPGLKLEKKDIQYELDRRKPGTSCYVTQRQENDYVEILSGCFEGYTTGTPIALIINNIDQRSKDYNNIIELFRPSHADYTYWHKYGIRDYRGGGRSSARLTAPLVAAGAIAKLWLYKKFSIKIRAYIAAIGHIQIPFVDWTHVSTNAFYSPNTSLVPQLENFINSLRCEGNSIGARINIIVNKVPVGWGEPIYSKLDADLAHALMGINAVKGIEIGAGFNSIQQKGSEYNDKITPTGFTSNNAGGILGGISSGQNIEISIAIKPTSSIRIPQQSIDLQGNAAIVETLGRHDPCVGIRAVPISEAVVALVLIDHALRHRAQCSDVKIATPCIT